MRTALGSARQAATLPVTALLIAVIAFGSGGFAEVRTAMAAFRAEVSNETNYVVSGTLVLRSSTPAGTCLSTGGGSSTDTNSSAADCPVVVGLTLAKPGDTTLGLVTLKNEGNTSGDLKLYSRTCGNTIALTPSTPAFTGSGNLCTAVGLTIRDVTSGRCIYPVSAPGPCTFDFSRTLSHFVSTTGSEASAVSFGALAGGASKDVEVGVKFDPAAGNEYQGRQAGFNLLFVATQ